jgi:hypothetical protein
MQQQYHVDTNLPSSSILLDTIPIPPSILLPPSTLLPPSRAGLALQRGWCGSTTHCQSNATPPAALSRRPALPAKAAPHDYPRRKRDALRLRSVPSVFAGLVWCMCWMATQEMVLQVRRRLCSALITLYHVPHNTNAPSTSSLINTHAPSSTLTHQHPCALLHTHSSTPMRPPPRSLINTHALTSTLTHQHPCTHLHTK